uniref:Integrase catalytic domain-containing protein n=1 Tax=Phlebotomus papatasi TaxID=29031 RepID=A0A1B0D864_PHLPP
MEIPVDVTDPSGRKLLTMEGLFSKISGEAEESCSSKGTLTGGDDGVLFEFQSKGRHTAFAGASQCQATVMLRVLPVEIAAPDKSNIVRILALLDSASSVSLIDGTLIRRLGVFGTQASMELMWLDGSSKEIHSTTEVTLAIRGVFPGAKWYELRNIRTMSDLILPEPTASDDDRLHESVLDPENYMRWDHMLKVAGYVYKFIDACRQRRRTNNLIEPNGKIFLTASDYKGGERCIIRQTQQECFHAEFECLAQSRTLENHENNRHVNAKLSKKSTIYKLNPGLDENGIIRAYGRIQMMPRASEDFKNPILLHAGNRAVQLMLTHYHQELGHWGTPLVMAELRQRFEIITGRKALKQIQMDCITCQKARSQPNVPIMGQIPEERLSAHVHPFTHTGCDFFGPLYVKTGRSEVKRYGAIFTCLTTRAIHLELCENLTTDSCILAIRRFMARRGEPETILSDNGTNFKGAEREIRQSLAEIKHDVITSTLAKRQVTWKFNPPHAPHMGGTWERLVAPVKKAISLAIGSSKHPPSQEVLQTVLAEAEHLVNSRPLAEVSDANEVLTPNHFLIHRQSGLQAPGTFTDQDLVLRKEWRKSQRLTDIFWKKWLQFYTPTLTHRPKWHSNNPNVKVGDRVMIVDPNLERNTWPVGRVVELYPGKDGKVRVVLVRTEDEHKVFKRPVA